MGSKMRVVGAGLVVALGTLVAASSAWAGGTWMYTSSDHTQLQINFHTDDGSTAQYEVFTLSVGVVSATCPGGVNGTAGPDNNPDQFECQISPAASSGMVSVTTDPEPCDALIANEASFNGSPPYIAQDAIMPISGNCAPPVAAFSVSSGQTAGSPVSFDGSESTDPNPGGGITAYSWNFGDGSASGSGAMVSHTYAQPGSYPVKLTVTDKEGGTASITHTITASSASGQKPPVAAFTVSPSSTKVGSPVSFDGSASHDPNPGGSIIAYTWDFGDDSSTPASRATVAHAYTAPGRYSVTLTVTDSEGGITSTIHEVTVEGGEPVNTGLPQISGDPVTGNTLTASTGTWTNNPTSFSYQWETCDQDGNNCQNDSQNRSGVAPNSFVPGFFEIKFTLRVVVTATNASGSSSATSEPTAVVEPPPLNVGSASTSGSTVTLPVGCSAPQEAINPDCVVLLLLAVLGGGPPTSGHAPDLAIAASCHHRKHCPKPLIVGKTKVKIRAGHIKNVRITLDRAGRRLLAKKHKLRVKLTITESGQVVSTRTIVFKSKKHH